MFGGSGPGGVALFAGFPFEHFLQFARLEFVAWDIDLAEDVDLRDLEGVEELLGVAASDGAGDDGVDDGLEGELVGEGVFDAGDLEGADGVLAGTLGELDSTILALLEGGVPAAEFVSGFGDVAAGGSVEEDVRAEMVVRLVV